MANPRRTSHTNPNQLPISDPTNNPFQSQSPTVTLLNLLKFYLKKPHAFPFLLSIFLFLTWVSLRLQQNTAFDQKSSYKNLKNVHGKIGNSGYVKDSNANAVKIQSLSSFIAKDKRGWLVNPISLALDAGITGGASSCASVHVGEIRPRGVRANHRHHTCNETFVIWGAQTVFRLENSAVSKGYSEVIVGADEVAVAASPQGTAHALVNVDSRRTTFFMGCQDSIINYNNNTTDFNVWKDL